MRSTLINKRRVVLAGALALACVCLSVVLAHAEPEKKTDQKPAPKKLTGAELYAINCNRCHPERYATEFTSAQWKTIMTAHARAGQSPRSAGEGNPQISPGRRRKLNRPLKNFTHENIFLYFRRGGGSLRVGRGPDSARGGDDQR